MKFTREAFDLIVKAPQYEGALTYLVDDNGNKVGNPIKCPWKG